MDLLIAFSVPFGFESGRFVHVCFISLTLALNPRPSN